MKKKAVALAVGLMSLVLVTGCNKADNTASTESEIQESTTVEAPSSSEETEMIDPEAEFEKIKSDLAYQGGLVASGDSDLEIAIFRYSGDPLALVRTQDYFNYGSYTTEDATLEDGTAYTKLIMSDAKEFGYYFNEDMSGFVVDENGVKYDAVAMDESAALDMVKVTIVGEPEEAGDPAAEFEAMKENLVYMGGLYISQPDNDLQLALFKNNGEPIVVISKLGSFYYDQLTTEDAKLDDGTEYQKVTFENEGKSFGYAFNDDMTGILIDEDGTKFDAKELDESVALDMVKYSVVGE